jgi:hypothetical protein
VTLADQASLIVALSDLKVVSLLTSAIRAADIQSGKELGPGGIAVDSEPRFRPRDTFQQTPLIAPRVVYHPTPRYEPRQVLHPTVKVEPNDMLMPANMVDHRKTSSPIQPPWKVLPWPETSHSTRKIKTATQRTDTNHVGSLIDIFI